MSYYKLEATYRVISNSGSRNKKTFRYYCKTYDHLLVQMADALNNKAKCTVRTISENEYVKGAH